MSRAIQLTHSDVDRGPPGLLYHSGALGDFVLSLPAIHRVAQAHPALIWRYWGPTDRLRLLPGFGPAPAELPRVGHTLWGDAPAPAVRATLERCQAILAFGGRTPPAWAGHADRSIGIASFPWQTGVHVVQHQKRQLDRLGVPPVRAPWLAAWRRRVLPARQPEQIVLHPGSGDRRKNLPSVVWTEVIDALARRRIGPTCLLVGPAEEERGGWTALATAVDRVEASADLEHLLALLARTALFLGNDSGTTHLAAFLGIPSVAVFGPSDPAQWRPWGPRVAVVRPGLSCAPCVGQEGAVCDHPRCTLEADPATIAREALRLLGHCGHSPFAG